MAHSAKEAEQVASSIAGEDMVIKAQVLAGGRGKGHFDNGFKGGVGGSDGRCGRNKLRGTRS